MTLLMIVAILVVVAAALWWGWSDPERFERLFAARHTTLGRGVWVFWDLLIILGIVAGYMATPFLDPWVFHGATGVVAFLLTLVILSPVYAGRSANAYERGDKSYLITFVKRPPNRLYLRKKAEKYIDFVGHVLPGRQYRGLLEPGLSPDSNEYWHLIECKKDGEQRPTGTSLQTLTEEQKKALNLRDRVRPNDKPPLGVEVHKSVLVRLWVWYINMFYDVALVGVRWIFEVNERHIEKFRLRRVTDEVTGRSKFVLEPPRPDELTNHVRTAPERWVVAVPSGEVKGARIPIDLIVILYIRTINPMLQERNQANWSQFVNDAAVDIAIRALASLTDSAIFDLDADLTKGLEASDPLNQEIRRIRTRLETSVGITIDDSTTVEDGEYSGGVQIVSKDPILEGEGVEEAFRAPWVAERRKKATILEGEAEADKEARVTREVAKAIQESGDAGVVARETDAIGHAAEAAKNATLMATFGRGAGAKDSGDESVALQKAILAELQKLNRRDT